MPWQWCNLTTSRANWTSRDQPSIREPLSGSFVSIKQQISVIYSEHKCPWRSGRRSMQLNLTSLRERKHRKLKSLLQLCFLFSSSIMKIIIIIIKVSWNGSLGTKSKSACKQINKTNPAHCSELAASRRNQQPFVHCSAVITFKTQPALLGKKWAVITTMIETYILGVRRFVTALTDCWPLYKSEMCYSWVSHLFLGLQRGDFIWGVGARLSLFCTDDLHI